MGSALENEEFLEKWKKSNKSQKRASIMDEAMEFASQKAFEDFGISPASFELGNIEINFDC